ncbi:MAG TPA: oxidoreductase [Chloroflexota bacterium]|nr:oxidoreductase [Chloroflexota bacterium]
MNARKPRIATVWLGGCSGCHMSLLDLDERLIELARLADVVFTPIADIKVFPEDVDVTLVEGAVANTDHLEMLHTVRDRTQVLAALGDCAITGNVTALRNVWPVEAVLHNAYVERASAAPQVPDEPGILPHLTPRVVPLHHVVAVDGYIPGCPPDADRIWTALLALLHGEPVLAVDAPAAKFG